MAEKRRASFQKGGKKRVRHFQWRENDTCVVSKRREKTRASKARNPTKYSLRVTPQIITLLNVISFFSFPGPIDVTQIAANFVSTKADVIVRMRGLPFSTKPSDIVSENDN